MSSTTNTFYSTANGKFLESTRVHVYPCAYRGINGSGTYIDVESKLQTEHNYTHLGTGQLGNNTFLFTTDWNSSSDDTKVVEFSINGYYFKINGLAFNGCPKYAYIKLFNAPIIKDGNEKSFILSDITSATETQPQTLDKLETTADNTSTYYFTGLAFTDNLPSTLTNVYYIQLKSDISTAESNSICYASLPPAVNTGTGAASLELNSSTTTASGNNAIAAGTDTVASHANAAAFGEGTITSTNDQVVIGKYNESVADSLLTVGCGSSSSARANILNLSAADKNNTLTLFNTSMSDPAITLKSTSGNWRWHSFSGESHNHFGLNLNGSNNEVFFRDMDIAEGAASDSAHIVDFYTTGTVTAEKNITIKHYSYTADNTTTIYGPMLYGSDGNNKACSIAAEYGHTCLVTKTINPVTSATSTETAHIEVTTTSPSSTGAYIMINETKGFTGVTSIKFRAGSSDSDATSGKPYYSNVNLAKGNLNLPANNSTNTPKVMAQTSSSAGWVEYSAKWPSDSSGDIWAKNAASASYYANTIAYRNSDGRLAAYDLGAEHRIYCNGTENDALTVCGGAEFKKVNIYNEAMAASASSAGTLSVTGGIKATKRSYFNDGFDIAGNAVIKCAALSAESAGSILAPLSDDKSVLMYAVKAGTSRTMAVDDNFWANGNITVAANKYLQVTKGTDYGELTIGRNTNTGLALCTDTTNNLYIRQDDEVFVQISSDHSAANASSTSYGTLYVQGGIKATQPCYFGSSVTAASSVAASAFSTAGSVTAKNISATSASLTAGLSAASATFTGQVQAESFYATSDLRKKENIQPYKYHDSVLDLEVKSFKYKGSDEQTIGLIAQDLQAVYPELVREDADGYLSINESKLVYLLIEEVKQLKTEIKELKKK